MISLARALLVVTAIAAVAWSAGALLFPSRARLGTLARVYAGLALCVLSLVGLAALGWLRPGPILTLGFAWAAAPWLLRFASSPPAAVEREPADSERAPARSFDLGWGLLGTVGLVWLVLAPLAASPQVSWDAAVYHLTLPRLFLEHEGFRRVPMSVYSEWPLGMELLYAVGLAFGGVPAAKMLHWACGLLLLTTLVAIGRRQGLSLSATAFGAALVLTSPIVLFELQVAYVDVALAAFVLAAFGFLSDRLLSEDPEPRDDRRLDASLPDPSLPDPSRLASSLLAAGTAAGLAAATKVTGGLLALASVVVLSPGLVRSAQRSRRPLRSALFLVLPLVALAAPWPLRAWIDTGNPIYPFAWERFGGPDWSPALAERFSAWQRSIGMGRELRDFLLLPLRVPLLGEQGSYARFDGAIGVRWLLVVPLLLASLRRRPARWALTTAGLHLVFWSLTSQQARFLIPTLPLLALSAAHGAAVLASGLGAGRLTRGPKIGGLAIRSTSPLDIALALMTIALAATALFGGSRPIATSSWNHLRIYTQHADPRALRAPVWAAVDELPGDARLVLLGTNRGWDASREFLADSFFEASQISDWLGAPTLSAAAEPDAAGVEARLRERGVTHLLVARREVRVAYPEGLVELLGQPERVETVYSDADHLLLALRPADAANRDSTR